MKNFLKGKKSYLSALAGVLIILAYHFGFITPELTSELLYIAGFAGLASLRAGLKSTVKELSRAANEIDLLEEDTTGAGGGIA